MDNRKIRIAKELMRLAKLLAGGEWDWEEEDSRPRKTVDELVNEAIGDLAEQDPVQVFQDDDEEMVSGMLSASGSGGNSKAWKKNETSFSILVSSGMDGGDACVGISMEFVDKGKTVYTDTSRFMLHSDFADSLYQKRGEQWDALWYCDNVTDEEFKTNLKNIFDKVVKKLKSIAPKIVKRIKECAGDDFSGSNGVRPMAAGIRPAASKRRKFLPFG